MNRGNDSGTDSPRARPDTSYHHPNDDDDTMVSVNDDGGDPGSNIDVANNEGTPILDDSGPSSSITPEGNKRGVSVLP